MIELNQEALKPLTAFDHPEPHTYRWSDLELKFINERCGKLQAEIERLKAERLDWIETDMTRIDQVGDTNGFGIWEMSLMDGGLTLHASIDTAKENK